VKVVKFEFTKSYSLLNLFTFKINDQADQESSDTDAACDQADYINGSDVSEGLHPHDVSEADRGKDKGGDQEGLE